MILATSLLFSFFSHQTDGGTHLNANTVYGIVGKYSSELNEVKSGHLFSAPSLSLTSWCRWILICCVSFIQAEFITSLAYQEMFAILDYVLIHV